MLRSGRSWMGWGC